VNAVLGIRDLQVRCIIGHYPHERETPQSLLITVELDLDVRAARSDLLTDTLDYDALAALLAERAQTGRYHLIEAYAQEASDAVLARWPHIQGLRLEVRKPEAIPGAAAAFIRLDRKKT
jgi:dihydroneopterin aldolase